MRDSVIIVGTGGHCRSIIDVILSSGSYEIIGLVDIQDMGGSIGKTINGYSVLGSLHNIESCCRPGIKLVIAVGDNFNREKVKDMIVEKIPYAQFGTYIHSRAYVSKGAEVGEGTVVMANAVINNGTKVGKHCIINTGSIIEHDNNINDFASVAPGAKLGGAVSIGRSSVVSIGATVLHNISIGDYTVIGAQSFVNEPLPDNVVAYGIPAKTVRNRRNGDRYL